MKNSSKKINLSSDDLPEILWEILNYKKPYKRPPKTGIEFPETQIAGEMIDFEKKAWSIYYYYYNKYWRQKDLDLSGEEYEKYLEELDWKQRSAFNFCKDSVNSRLSVPNEFNYFVFLPNWKIAIAEEKTMEVNDSSQLDFPEELNHPN